VSENETAPTTTWWTACRYDDKPKPVEVTRETKQCLYTIGWRGREERRLKSGGYFRTYEEAVNWLAHRALDRQVNAQWNLREAERRVARLRELYPDSPAWLDTAEAYNG
jgi:hypothetical protein